MAAQIGLVLGGLALLTLAPPASGRMLLLPLDARAARGLMATAVAHGALLVEPGRRGAMVVVGERHRLMLPLLSRGVVVMAAPPAAGCTDRSAV